MRFTASDRRLIKLTDVVYNYGDLPEWSIIECKSFGLPQIPLNMLMVAIGKDADANPRFLDLYAAPDDLVLAVKRLLA